LNNSWTFLLFWRSTIFQPLFAQSLIMSTPIDKNTRKVNMCNDISIQDFSSSLSKPEPFSYTAESIKEQPFKEFYISYCTSNTNTSMCSLTDWLSVTCCLFTCCFWFHHLCIQGKIKYSYVNLHFYFNGWDSRLGYKVKLIDSQVSEIVHLKTLFTYIVLLKLWRSLAPTFQLWAGFVSKQCSRLQSIELQRLRHSENCYNLVF